MWLVWLLEKGDVRSQGGVLGEHIGAIAAGIDHLEFGFIGQDLFRQIVAGHPFGHHHICQQQADFAAVLFPDLESCGPCSASKTV